MEQSGCFLHNPGVISAVLESTLAGGLEAARLLGATHGAIVAAIVVDGKLHLDAQALGGDVMTENNPNRKWIEDPKTGINYVGYATGKIMQSIRTGVPSNEGSALGYGESDAVGSYREICFCLDPDGNKIQFLLLAAYSGMSSEEDLRASQDACRDGWFQMSGYKNFDGSDIQLSRAVGHCINS